MARGRIEASRRNAGRRRWQRSILFVPIAALILGVMQTALPADAASADRVLILAGTVTGGASSIEASEVVADGLAVDVVDAPTWSSMTSAQFASYRAIILGDPTCSGITDDISAAAANAGTWGSALNGNVLIAGTDPVFHATQGGETLTRRAVDYAVAQSGKTGAYISLSCYYHDTAPSTPVPLLDGIGSGGFNVTGVGCYNDAHIVAESSALAGLTDADISNWSCSVHEAFQSWPGSLVPLAIARDFDSSYTASDGSQGPPYILAGGDIRSFPLSLTPLSDTASAGSSHTVTAQLLDGLTRAPISGATIGFGILSGPNAGVAGRCSPASCLTDSSGHVTWTYSSNGRTGDDTIRAFYDTNDNTAADPGEPQTTAGMSWTAPIEQRYVALGDSYSSGEGAIDSSGDPAFEAGTDVAGNRCHRSMHAYSRKLKTDLSVSDGHFIFRACSGAILADFVTKVGQVGQWNEGPQLDAIAPAKAPNLDTTLVTLSVGGNDADFPQVLDHCITGFGHWRPERKCLDFAKAHADKGEKLLANGGTILVHPSTDPIPGTTWEFCDNVCRILHPFSHILKVPSLAGLYEQIHTRSPNAKIRVLLYPHLFATSPPDRCIVGTFDAIAASHSYTLSKVEMMTLNSLGDDLNKTIAAQVGVAKSKGVNIEAVNPVDQFAGHGLCDSQEPWINGALWSGRFLWQKSPFSFHPNSVGQKQFASVIEGKL